MRFTVYVDAAHSAERGVGAWSFLIYTDLRYIDWMGNKSKFLNSPTCAEDIAIGLACRYLMDNITLDKTDIVTICSDSLSSIRIMSDIMDGKRKETHSNILIEDSFKAIKELSEKCNVAFMKVRGHKPVLNPNICVDRLSKCYLRG